MSVSPIAPRTPTTRLHHGDEFVDHYEWLRDKDDADVQAHLENENAYTESSTAHLADLRENIFQEIKGRTRETDMSVPGRKGDWWYYRRIEEGQNYSRLCRVPLTSPDDWNPPEIESIEHEQEQVLLDSNLEADEHAFFQLGSTALSHDHNLLAWTVDTEGDERYRLNIRNLHDGSQQDAVVTDIAPSVVWSCDASCFFYVRVDASWRPFQVWRHDIGSEGPDELVFEEPDERYFVGIGSTLSEKFLMISVGSKITSELRYVPSDAPRSEFQIVWPRETGVEYFADHLVIGGRDHWVFLHNKSHPNFELTVSPVDSPTESITILTGSDSIRLDDLDVTEKYVYLSFRSDALPRVGVMAVTEDGLGPMSVISTEAELTAYGVGAGSEPNPKYVRLATSSFVEPAKIFDFDPETGETFLRKQGEVLGKFDADEYLQERLWVTAEDGTRVPVSIVARRDTPRDGTAPALLYGYGSYEVSLDPGFSIPRLSLLDRGFVFAIAHVRGGGELGRFWYDNGKLLHKKNTFTDFVACARALVTEGWTSADRLVAEGGSAGGLLVGAALNLAPDAFCGIVADVPFVDPLTSILDPELPLTVIEWDEWGNPLAEASVYEYMKSYSPYENVAPRSYPAVLAVTSLNDTRVLYVEPAKWIARLREVATDGGPFLLKTEMSAGHGGVSGRYAAWRERAWELSWIIDVCRGGPSRNPRIT